MTETPVCPQGRFRRQGQASGLPAGALRGRR